MPPLSTFHRLNAWSSEEHRTKRKADDYDNRDEDKHVLRACHAYEVVDYGDESEATIDGGGTPVVAQSDADDTDCGEDEPADFAFSEKE